MNEFLKRLLDNPFLRRSRIERDERGRVSRVAATLAAGGDGASGDDEVHGGERAGDSNPGATPPERPEPDADERARLRDAARWLDAVALRDARAFALGEERSYGFDQDTGALSLRHADGAILVLPGQILGSFRPHDRSFRWAWANPNVAPTMVRAALTARERMASAAFQVPTFQTSYRDGKALAALAARLGGCRGAYRAVTDDHLSVFVGYGEPDGLLPPVATEGPGSDAPADAELVEVTALVDRYDAAMLPHDVEAHERETALDPCDGAAQLAVLDAVLAAKKRDHDRFWHRADGYWDPISVDWPSPHDPVRQKRRFAVPRRAGGAYVIMQAGHRTDALVVERVGGATGGEWRITDRDLGWGKGLPLLTGDELVEADETPGPASSAASG